MINDTIIRTDNLSKHYGDIRAVSDINLHVRKGEIYGFLGLNGAGKTTTIRMLLGMIRPTKGKSFIQGELVSSNNNETLKKIGYMVEIPHSYLNLTVAENLEIIRRLRFIKNKNAVSEIIDRLQLGSYKDRKAKNLSLGNAQRLGLAKALIHQPEILILDEPTNGLDPAGIYEVREMLTEMATQYGVTIFISSHILGEVSKFASRIGIIHAGKMIQEFDSIQLESLCNKELHVKASDLVSVYSVLKKGGYQQVILNEDRICIHDDKAITKPDEIATLMVNAGCPPTLLQVQEENLESYFLRTINMNGGVK